MSVAYQIQREIFAQLGYAQLVSFLLPPESKGGVHNPLVRDAFNMVIEFLNTADERDFIERGPGLLNVFNSIVKQMKEIAPPRKDLSLVASEFMKLRMDDANLLTYGIPFEWLDEHIDTSKLLEIDVPFQARIGTGYHAGKWSVEEMYLLSDGFYFLVKARSELERLLALGTEINRNLTDGYPGEKDYFIARDVNLNVCGYSRNSVVNLYSFLECFVNATGFDFYLRNKKTLDTDTTEILCGKKGGRFLSLLRKLNLFAAIVSRQSPSTKAWLNEFPSELEEARELRDSAMHYSPLKYPIWRKPTDWVPIAERSSEVIMEIARQFWGICYPARNFPPHLLSLDSERCVRNARMRAGFDAE